MKKITPSIISLLLLLFSASAESMHCKITYNLKGWSFFYKEYMGIGVVICSNGQHASISIISRGGGITVGKSEINKGHGVFSEIYNINEIYGTYVAIDGHAGFTKSVEGQVMIKGVVLLALSGQGRGVDLGVSLSAFSIKPR